ncbi:MAG: penicillin acylase family protein, partial [Ignavibacteriales bacterium]|nr:penicillin acylase family protein [Ignavibacteriales bacterium]
MSKTVKIVFGIGLSLIVIAVVSVILLRNLLTKSFPVVEGNVIAHGLEKPVHVMRDGYGVPHILARSEHDLFFTQGYVHAQDRLWQMDLERRAALGRLSEVLGTRTLPYDKLFRTVGLGRIADSLESALHPESRRILQAYADGVNCFIASHRGKYPIEFDMLNYEPEPWTIRHSLALMRLAAWELNMAWYVDLTLGELVRRLGEEKANQVFPTYPENAPIMVPKELAGKKMPLAALDFWNVDKEFRATFGFSGMHVGSNAWVVGPKRSVSGKAMLANDPHLAYTAPARWYELHMKGGSYDVAGVSLPGAPLIVIGHTKDIAWGMTNVMADDADFFVEKQDTLRPELYQYRDQWRTFETYTDTIVVKDSLPVVLMARSSVHGPIVNDVHPRGGAAGGAPLALRWTGQNISDEFFALSIINRAKDWSGFLGGVKHFTVPGQNFLYADAEGNIGYHAGVRLPVRGTQNPSLPLPGWTGEYDWRGFVPFEELPWLYNPPEGFIASANNKLVDNSFPYHISNLWEPPSRIQRIRDMLMERPQCTVGDFKTMQLDTYSAFARDVVPHILIAYDSTTAVAPVVENALRHFRNWHFQELRDDVTSTLFQFFMTHLLQNTFEDEMGPELFHDYIFMANMPYRVIMAMLQRDNAEWFDDVRTPDVETKNEIVRKSLMEALNELQ